MAVLAFGLRQWCERRSLNIPVELRVQQNRSCLWKRSIFFNFKFLHAAVVSALASHGQYGFQASSRRWRCNREKLGKLPFNVCKDNVHGPFLMGRLIQTAYIHNNKVRDEIKFQSYLCFRLLFPPAHMHYWRISVKCWEHNCFTSASTFSVNRGSGCTLPSLKWDMSLVWFECWAFERRRRRKEIRNFSMQRRFLLPIRSVPAQLRFEIEFSQSWGDETPAQQGQLGRKQSGWGSSL